MKKLVFFFLFFAISAAVAVYSQEVVDKNNSFVDDICLKADTLECSIPEVTDTLLVAKTARNIRIIADVDGAKITVKNIDNTGNNFYYETDNKKHKSGQTEVGILSEDVTDVILTETSLGATVSYVDNNGARQNYNFRCTEPENRSVTSYLGSKRSNLGIELSRSGRTTWQVISGGLGFGWVTALNSEPSMNVSMWNSIELNWLMILAVRMDHGAHHLSMGMGINWRNFVTNRYKYFDKDENGHISLVPYDEDGLRDTRSRIKMFSLQLPLFYEYSFGYSNNFGIVAGPVVNFNTSANILTEYKIGERNYSEKINKVGLRPVTVDFMAMLRWQFVGAYVRYAPMTPLKSSTNLSFSSLSTGLLLFF